jgi:hypothetical protein
MTARRFDQLLTLGLLVLAVGYASGWRRTLTGLGSFRPSSAW